MTSLAPSGPITVRDLRLRYDGRTVLDIPELSIPAGAVVGLVGSNGAGKSSLMRCLLGLTLPEAGDLRVLGDAPTALSDATRAALGFVPQTPELVDWMKVGQHLDFIGSFYPAWNARWVGEKLAAWNLPIDRRVTALSLGEKQKLSLLLALGHAPQLVLLDEPVASLDPLARREFMRSLFDLDAERTVMISSHLLSDLERVISHVVLLKAGRVVLCDEWDALGESLRRVASPTRLPEHAGLLVRRTDGSGDIAVVDTRRLPLAELPRGASASAMNLDDLFVEMMS